MEEELAKLKTQVEQKQSEMDEQEKIVDAMKGAKKDPKDINAAEELLNNPKLQVQTEKGEVSSMFEEGRGKGKSNSDNKESIRQLLGDALTRRLFFIPAFKIYGGVAGLYDYGPPPAVLSRPMCLPYGVSILY
ncbi:unnamed protein product [Calypogeia fissa]